MYNGFVESEERIAQRLEKINKNAQPLKTLKEQETPSHADDNLRKALADFNQSIRDWNATVERINAEAEARPARIAPRPIILGTLRAWIIWAVIVIVFSGVMSLVIR